MSAWKDITSYRQGEIGDKRPAASVWSLDIKSIRLRVHRTNYAPESWFVSCYDLDLRDCLLDATEIEAAKQESIMRMHRRALYFAELLATWDAAEGSKS